MTKWAGLSDMYVLIRSDCRYYLGIYYLATYPVLHGWDGNTARRSCRGMLIRSKAVIYVDWELPDKFRGEEGRWSIGSL